MKLRDFNKKPKSINHSPQIVVTNDAAEARYKAQIEELDSQLGLYRRIEAERDEATSKFNSIEETLQSERLQADLLREEIPKLSKQIHDQQKQLDKIPELEESTRASGGQAAQLKTELDEFQQTAVRQSQDLSLLKQELSTLQTENEELVKVTADAVSIKQSTDADFEAISNKNKELQSFTDETSKINKELIKENKSLRDWANYKDIENKELAIKLEDLKSVETKIREWMSKMETKDSQTTSSKNSLENKVATQQKVITDMSKTLDDMIKELAYLTKLNSGYRSELAKPTYTSMSAIASQEGFVMPNGKENIRTQNLGNYKPTLLKFKKKGETTHG